MGEGRNQGVWEREKGRPMPLCPEKKRGLQTTARKKEQQTINTRIKGREFQDRGERWLLLFTNKDGNSPT